MRMGPNGATHSQPGFDSQDYRDRRMTRHPPWRSANYREEWRTTDDRSLKEIQVAEAGSSFANSECFAAAICILNENLFLLLKQH